MFQILNAHGCSVQFSCPLNGNADKSFVCLKTLFFNFILWSKIKEREMWIKTEEKKMLLNGLVIASEPVI